MFTNSNTARFTAILGIILLTAVVLSGCTSAPSSGASNSNIGEPKLSVASEPSYGLEIAEIHLFASPDTASSAEQPPTFTIALEGTALLQSDSDTMRLSELKAYLVDDQENILAASDADFMPDSSKGKHLFAFTFNLTQEKLDAWTGYHLVLESGEPVAIHDEPSASVSYAKSALDAVLAEQRMREEKNETEGNDMADAPGNGDYSDTLLIGDSIMVLTSYSVEEALPGVCINASSGRSLETGGPNEAGSEDNGVLDYIRRDSLEYERYVIGTGSNDPEGMSFGDAEEIVSCLPGKQIWFVTEYVSNNVTGTANTNSAVDAVCAKYSNVHKIDWNALVTSHTEWLMEDNCHPQMEEGQDAYAALVKEALGRK